MLLPGPKEPAGRETNPGSPSSLTSGFHVAAAGLLQVSRRRSPVNDVSDFCQMPLRVGFGSRHSKFTLAKSFGLGRFIARIFLWLDSSRWKQVNWLRLQDFSRQRQKASVSFSHHICTGGYSGRCHTRASVTNARKAQPHGGIGMPVDPPGTRAHAASRRAE